MIRAAAAAGAALMLAMASGCTVRPLLATQEGVPGRQTTASLASVAVNPVSTRYAQEVRNELIFLLHGGAAQPVAPRYNLDLSVVLSVGSAAEVQRAHENEPTAGTVTLIATYRLTEAATGEPVAQGNRQVMSAFDRPLQEFAVLRAQRDAEDRAARELAELLRLAVAQDMARLNLQ
ncbi:LPS assembly lipoprotein LptE [Chelativorans sp. AA-79]|uniref:LPS assembly lipoprotein LptE n=1 Tax=Chelativorans sp. AA-79 TaxID=3028735 RepID=UPI0023F9ADBD|nr:LPS assembly lipoprotein LptE [Chelativorans sp. AA-79]WEX11777.1 LPS assembly lipoprotein LptE [Chelativorans sp. AA-79]